VRNKIAWGCERSEARGGVNWNCRPPSVPHARRLHHPIYAELIPRASLCDHKRMLRWSRHDSPHRANVKMEGVRNGSPFGYITWATSTWPTADPPRLLKLATSPGTLWGAHRYGKDHCLTALWFAACPPWPGRMARVIPPRSTTRDYELMARRSRGIRLPPRLASSASMILWTGARLVSGLEPASPGS